jgi:hypothetical protein
VAEWFKAPVLKTGVPARVPWVRIPPLPPKGENPRVVRGYFAFVPHVSPHATDFSLTRLPLKQSLRSRGIPSCNFRVGSMHGVCRGRLLWCCRLNTFGRCRGRRLGGGDRRVTGRLHSHGYGYWCPSPRHAWQIRSNDVVQSRGLRSSWPGARRVPDDMRRAITITGFTPKWLVHAGCDSWRNLALCSQKPATGRAIDTMGIVSKIVGAKQTG